MLLTLDAYDTYVYVTHTGGIHIQNSSVLSLGETDWYLMRINILYSMNLNIFTLYLLLCRLTSVTLIGPFF